MTAAGWGAVPLVADIHFLPQAAMEAVEHVEKVRVNPGNYADKKRFAVREYSDADYDRELQRLHEAFSPLVKRSKELGRSMRIGTNHGSLSDRIMNRYGDTPLGMVESALEFLRIAESHGFREIILSMKSSNPKVMIEAYRLLVERMDAEDMHYPLHLGVTEAGDGEDGRIKGAIGIGSLLLDGLGDTIRVSLTEDSVYEIPVARAIADKAMSAWVESGGTRDPPHDSIDPFHFERRVPAALRLGSGVEIGPEQPPRVDRPDRGRRPGRAARSRSLPRPGLKETPAEGLLVPIAAAEEIDAVRRAIGAAPGAVGFVALELAPALRPADLEAALAGLETPVVLLRRFGAGGRGGARRSGAASRKGRGASSPPTGARATPRGSSRRSRRVGRRSADHHPFRGAGPGGATTRSAPTGASPRRCGGPGSARPALDPQHRRHRRSRRQQLSLAPARGELPHRRPALRRPRRPGQHRDRGRPGARRAPCLQRPAGRGRPDLQGRVRRLPELRPHALRPADDDPAHPRADRRT